MRARLLVERVESAVEALGEISAEIVAELGMLGDVEAVEIELETITAAAEQRAAEARTAAASADACRRTAETALLEAERRRDEARDLASEALAAQTASHTAQRAAESELATEQAQRSSIERQLAAAKSDAATQAQAAREAVALAEQHSAALVTLRQRLVDREHEQRLLQDELAGERADLRHATQAVEALTAERDLALTERDRSRAAVTALQADAVNLTAERRAAEDALARSIASCELVTSERDGVRYDLATAAAQVAGLTAELRVARTGAEAAAEAAERSAVARVADLRAVYEERLDDLRSQLSADRGPRTAS